VDALGGARKQRACRDELGGDDALVSVLSYDQTCVLGDPGLLIARLVKVLIQLRHEEAVLVYDGDS